MNSRGMLVVVLAFACMFAGCGKKQSSSPDNPPAAGGAGFQPAEPGVERAIYCCMLEPSKRQDRNSVQRTPLLRAALLLENIYDDDARDVLAVQLRRAGVTIDAMLAALAADSRANWDYPLESVQSQVRLALADRVEQVIGELFNDTERSARAAAALDRIDPQWRSTLAAKAFADKMLTALTTGKLDDSVVSLRADLLRRAASQPDAVNSHAADELGRVLLGGHSGVGPVGPDYADRLVLASTHQAAAAAMVQLKDPRAIDPLAKFVLETCDDERSSQPQWVVAPQLFAAMAAVGGDFNSPSPARSAVDAMLNKLLNRELRGYALDCLAELPVGPREFAVLLALVDADVYIDRHGTWRDHSVNALRPQAINLRYDSKHGLSTAMLLLARHCQSPSASDEQRAEAAAVARRLLAEVKDDYEYPRPIMLLAVCGGDAVVPDLLALAEKNAKLLEPVLIGLGLSDGKSAVEPLAQAMRTGFIGGGGSSPETLFASLPADEQERLTRRYGSRAEAVKRFKPRMMQTKGPSRDTAVFAMSLFRGDAVVPVLREALADQDDQVARLAAVALGNRRDADSVPALLDVLESARQGQTPAAAANALLNINPPASERISRIVSRLIAQGVPASQPDEDDIGRYLDRSERRYEVHVSPFGLAEFMARFGGRRAITMLVLAAVESDAAMPLLTSIDLDWPASAEARAAVSQLCPLLPSPRVVRLLDLIGDASAVDPLIYTIGQSSDSERPLGPDAIVAILDRLDGNWRSRPAARKKLADLINVVSAFKVPAAGKVDDDFRRDWEQEQRDTLTVAAIGSAVELLALIGDASAGPAVLNCFQQAVKASQVAKFNNTYEALAGVCVDCLGRLGYKQAGDVLLAELSRCLKGPDESSGGDGSDRIDVHRPAWTMRGQSAAPYIENVCQTLGRLHEPRAVPVLLNVLDHQWQVDSFGPRLGASPPAILQAAADALANIGGQEAVAVLIARVNQPQIRMPVAAALARLGPAGAAEPLIRSLYDPRGVEKELFASLDRLDADWRKSAAAVALLNELVNRLTEDDKHDIRIESFGWRESRPPSMTVLLLDNIDPQWRTSERAGAVVGRLCRQIDASGFVSNSALAVLAEIRDRRAMSHLLAMPQQQPPSGDPWRRPPQLDAGCLFSALYRIDASWPSSLEARQAVPGLIGRVNKWLTDRARPDADYEARQMPLAVTMLSHINDPRVMPALLAAAMAIAKNDTQDSNMFDLLRLVGDRITDEAVGNNTGFGGELDRNDAGAWRLAARIVQQQRSPALQRKLFALAATSQPDLQPARKNAVALLAGIAQGAVAINRQPGDRLAREDGPAAAQADLLAIIEAGSQPDLPGFPTVREVALQMLGWHGRSLPGVKLLGLFTGCVDRLLVEPALGSRLVLAREATYYLPLLNKADPKVCEELRSKMQRLADKIDWKDLTVPANPYFQASSPEFSLCISIAEALAVGGDPASRELVESFGKRCIDSEKTPMEERRRIVQAVDEIRLTSRLRAALKEQP